MSETKYTQEHEWIRVEGDVGTVGITDYAQGQLGDVVYVELPAVGKAVKQGGDMAVVESVKAASEVYAPVSGEVVAVNSDLNTQPELLNSSPHDSAWLIKVKITAPGELDGLLSAADYQSYLG